MKYFVLPEVAITLKRKEVNVWVALCVAACSITFSACDEDNDFGYNGKLSLNYLGIKQASEIWDGAQCNIVTALKEPQEGEVQKVKNFNYRLNLALYQNRKAEKVIEQAATQRATQIFILFFIFLSQLKLI